MLVVGAVGAIAVGMILGFRHQANLERARARRRYLTADDLPTPRLLPSAEDRSGEAAFGRPESAQAEEINHAMVTAGEVTTVDGDGLAGQEGRVT